MTTLRVLVSFLLALQLAAADLPTATPEAVGMSAERLDKISALVKRAIEEGRISGAVTLVARRGKVVHYRAHGYADLEAQQPMSTDSVFRLESMTKPIVSVALMTLYEDAKFQLRDPISQVLPEFKDPVVMVPDGSAVGGFSLTTADREINFRDILTHTAGLSSGRGAMPNAPLYAEKVAPLRTSGASLEEVVQAFASIPLAFHPGTQFRYSRGTDVVGRLVEVLGGQPFGVFLNERLFKPLRMNDTRFAYAADPDRFAMPYATVGGLRRINIRPRTYPDGAAGLSSTAADYFRFAQMMLNGGSLNGAKVISRKTVELMTSNHIGDLPFLRPGNRFGLGFRITTDVGEAAELRSLGSYSWAGALGTTFVIDPQEELIAIFMVQAARNSVSAQFEPLVYAAIDD